MQDKIYAVIDTNVIVSALYTSNPESPTKKVIDSVLQGKVIPLLAEEIINEYQEVLSRPQFPFRPDNVAAIINAIKQFGTNPGRLHTDEKIPDSKDIVFYEIALSKKDSYLVTGNTRHFPKKALVVTPAEFIEIIKRK